LADHLCDAVCEVEHVDVERVVGCVVGLEQYLLKLLHVVLLNKSSELCDESAMDSNAVASRVDAHVSVTAMQWRQE